MRFFSRQPAAGSTAHTPAASHGHSKRNCREHGTGDYTMLRRPPFGQWLKHTWLDILTMVCMGALGLGVR